MRVARPGCPAARRGCGLPDTAPAGLERTGVFFSPAPTRSVGPLGNDRDGRPASGRGRSPYRRVPAVRAARPRRPGVPAGECRAAGRSAEIGVELPDRRRAMTGAWRSPLGRLPVAGPMPQPYNGGLTRPSHGECK